MPSFTYLARDTAGRPQQGTLDAASYAAAVRLLRGQGWRILKVQSQAPVLNLPRTIRSYVNPLSWLPPRSLDIELSLYQIAVMLRSGLTLLTALKTVAEQTRKVRLRRIWEDVIARIEEGASLTEALSVHPCFPPLVVQLVRVGEQTGTLDTVVERAARTLEQRRVVFTNLLTALAYPTIVFIAAMGVTVFMLVKVIPQLQKFLQAMGRKLPPITQLLLDISTWLQTYGLYLAMTLGLALVAAWLFYSTPAGRVAVDRLVLRLPIVGHVLRLAATAAFASALGILLRSGITLLDGLHTVEQLHRNRFLAGCIARARESVLRGGDLASGLTVSYAFTPLLPRMVAVGEAAGTLDEVLEELTKFHESQLQVAIRRLSAHHRTCDYRRRWGHCGICLYRVFCRPVFGGRSTALSGRRGPSSLGHLPDQQGSQPCAPCETSGV